MKKIISVLFFLCLLCFVANAQIDKKMQREAKAILEESRDMECGLRTDDKYHVVDVCKSQLLNEVHPLTRWAILSKCSYIVSTPAITISITRKARKESSRGMVKFGSHSRWELMIWLFGEQMPATPFGMDTPHRTKCLREYRVTPPAIGSMLKESWKLDRM